MKRINCNSIYKCVIVFAMMLCFVVSAKADVLGYMDYNKTSGAMGVSDTLKIQFYHKQGATPDYNPLEWYIQISDIGSTFHITSADSASFDDCVTMLTNGIDEEVYMSSTIVVGGGSFTHGAESEKFIKIGFDAPDFAGYEIQSIALKLNAMTIVSPGSNPNGDGNWTDFTIDADLEIYGVPEPATLVMLGMGSLALFRKRKRC